MRYGTGARQPNDGKQLEFCTHVAAIVRTGGEHALKGCGLSCWGLGRT